MTDIEHIAAIVAAGLVNNEMYQKCVRIADFNQGRPARYDLDVERVATDALAVARTIVGLNRDLK